MKHFGAFAVVRMDADLSGQQVEWQALDCTLLTSF